MTDLANIVVKVDSREVKGAIGDINKLGTEAENTKRRTKDSTDGMSKGFGGVAGAAKILTGVLAAVGFGKLVSGFTATVMESEKLKGALTTMTGSTENANKAFNKLNEFAAKTPFTLDQSVQGFIKLKALGLDPSERALMSYGNTASAMGKDMMQMIEAVADASTGEFERLKEFGIKAKKQGDEVSLTFQGVTTTIGNSSAEIQGYLLEIGENQFGTAMADQMKRLPGLISNLQDNIGALFRKFGEVGGISLFAGAVTLASSAIVLITDNIELVVTGIQVFGAALAAYFAPAIIMGMVGSVGAIKGAVIALNLAIMANPFAIAAAAAAAAAILIYRNFDEITAAAERSAIHIQIAWNQLKLFLMEAFAPALSAISDLFTDVQHKAVATWTAIAAAAKNPLSAIETFNTTFDKTLVSLKAGEKGSNVFSTSIDATKKSIITLEEKLATTNKTIVVAENVIEDATFSLSDFKIEVEETTSSQEDMNKAAKLVLGTLSNEREALNLSSLQLAIRNNLQKAGVDATSDLGKQIVEATTALHLEEDALKAVGQAAKQTEKDNEVAQGKIAKEAEDAARIAQEKWARTHEFMTVSLLDIAENGGNAFDSMAKAFETMVKRMVAEWVASKLMNLFGLGGGGSTGGGGGFSLGSIFGGGGSGTSSPGGSLVDAAINKGISTAITKVGAALGIGGSAAAAGTAVGGTAGVSTVFAAGASSGAGITSSAIGGTAAAGAGTGGTLASIGASIKGGLASAGSSAMSLISAIPGWGWALGGAVLLAKVLAKEETLSSNGGFLIRDIPSVSSDRKFDVPAFDSGFDPVGFARREDQGAASEIINVFRADDAMLTALAKANGLNVNYNDMNFGGYNEKGQGNGLFFGTASEDGKNTAVSLEDQRSLFISHWLRGLSGQVDQTLINNALSQGSADAMLQKAAAIGGYDGSHASGLRRVPFDGYRAELHKNEEVLTAGDPRNANNGGDSMLVEMRKIAASVKRTADILMRVTRDGDALLTESLA